MIQNVDNLQGCTIVSNPIEIVGSWTQILCLSNITSIDLTDENLIPLGDGTPSLQWTDADALQGVISGGRSTTRACGGTMASYGQPDTCQSRGNANRWL